MDMALRSFVFMGIARVVGCAAKPGALVQAEPSSTRSGSVGAELIEPPAQTRYENLEDVDYLQPRPSTRNAMPLYPPHLLDKRLASTQVTVRLVVGTDGLVERAVIVDGEVAEPGFAEAVLEAALDWTFSPLTRVVEQLPEPLPFTQHYRFTFRQVEGRGVVESVAGE